MQYLARCQLILTTIQSNNHRQSDNDWNLLFTIIIIIVNTDLLTTRDLPISIITGPETGALVDLIHSKNIWDRNM